MVQDLEKIFTGDLIASDIDAVKKGDEENMICYYRINKLQANN